MTMLLRTYLGVFVVVVLAGACKDDKSSGAGDSGVGADCTGDSDCSNGTSCVDGACVPDSSGCTADTDCATDESCVEGACVSDSEDCTDDTDCATGESCVDGACVPDTDCVGDTDCEDGESCVDGACVPDSIGDCVDDTNCEDGETCVDGTCEGPCTLGTEGCACIDGSDCVAGAYLPPLSCQDDVCLPCIAGEQGCQCAGGNCNDGLECTGTVCEPADCVPGALDCKCDSGNCTEGSCVGGICVDDTCTPGNSGCACGDGDTCVSGLTCSGGVCNDPNCPAGTHGCACLDEECGTTVLGEPMLCQGGLCESSNCTSGELACACANGIDCDDGEASCVDGLCKAASCIPGQLGCDCLAGGCNPGLGCKSDICVDMTGQIGGPCNSNNTCGRNARCDDSVFPSVCVYCDLGTHTCQCTDDDGCNPGMSCLIGHCAGDATVQSRNPPDNPNCWTPCNDDLDLTDGGMRECQSDGLMEGCIEGNICDEGSCVEDGGSRKMCFADGDCPSFQLCMKGYCYAECSSSSDCDDGMTCHLRVCRESCDLTENTCAYGETCDSSDGQNGFCVPGASSSGETGQASGSSGMRLSETLLRMSNVDTERTIQIINESSEYVKFTVTKTEHQVVYATGTQETVRLMDLDGPCSGSDCPLWWLETGEVGAISRDNTYEVNVEPLCEQNDSCPLIAIRIPSTGSVDATAWTGAIRVESSAGSQTLNLSYVERPEGRWAGQMVYFANFDDIGIDSTQTLRGWLERNRDDVEGLASGDLGVNNGLIQRWGAFRTGNLQGGWTEMEAVLRATETEQWRFPSVQEDCQVTQGACYLFANGSVGSLPRSYVTSLESSPIPTGVTKFPIAMNLHIPSNTNPEILEGRVVSEISLHLAGDPKVTMQFVSDPSNSANCDPDVTSNCVNFLEAPTTSGEPVGFEFDVAVGGRYPKMGTTDCVAGFEELTMPWLVPGFLDGTEMSNTGFYSRPWCVDMRLPAYTDPIGDILEDEAVSNSSLARGNPIPNGQVLERHMELLDGAMVDQQHLFILFREVYPSFLGDDDFYAYGYMVLKRRAVDLNLDDDNGNNIPDDYEGTTPPTGLGGVAQTAGVICSEDILDEVLGGGTLNATNAPNVVNALINGNTGTPATLTYPAGNTNGCSGTGEEVHYLCEDTGLFNGGLDNASCWGRGSTPNNDNCGSSDNGECDDGGINSDNSLCSLGTDVTDCGYRYLDPRTPCPLESKVIYFTAPASAHDDIVDNACQDTGTCMTVLNDWTASGSMISHLNPTWSCAGGLNNCEITELDRREGKIFYAPGDPDVHFTALRPAIENAFSYKTRFVGRSGTNLGFTPEICIPFSTTTPYCYSPEDIEAVTERVDCLQAIYRDYYADELDPSHSDLFAYLTESFSFREEANPIGGMATKYDGFEHLNAELLIMLGDNAYTSAFESRFDLAGMNAAGFQGEDFEDGGINISGIAGFEMFTLHQAVQYYSMVLNRFYKMTPVISAALELDTGMARKVVNPETVTSYFSRLIRASTQRSRALAEIVRRYQGFNRPDLAKRVALRAYTATYLEAVALNNVILGLYENTGGSDQPGILVALEEAQKRYRMALLDVANVNQSISEDVNFFGFAPDYIPFPALPTTIQSSDVTAFDRVLTTTLSKLEAARMRENEALAKTREFDTDEASFQSELTQISRTYENQLGEICGIFTASDGRVLPAVERYAYLDPNLSALGDPCGFVGNGSIRDSVADVDQARLELLRVLTQMNNVHERIRIRAQTVSAVCKQNITAQKFRYKVAGKLRNLEEDMIRTEQLIESVRTVSQAAQSMASTTVCGMDAVQCGQAVGAIVGIGVIVAAEIVGVALLHDDMADLRGDKFQIEQNLAFWEVDNQCQLADIELNGETRVMLLDLRELEISLLSARYRLALAMSQVEKQRQLAKRVALELDETLELSINVQAAKNNPNIRIYRNDAVINAEIAFDDAIRDAYKLTLVYQYYTSQSYAKLDQLFLTRMVQAGDYNLDNYVADLRNAFTYFQETFGNPDDRVIVLSLADDILRIPRLDENGLPLTVDTRASMLREELADPSRLNTSGYISVPFATRLEDQSPLTRNHKITYIEANIQGNDLGDYLARLYLRLVGTSTVAAVEGDHLYYRFPEKTAVLNPFLKDNRAQIFSNPQIYQNFRLRDQPLVNNNWELVINLRDEMVNDDLDLSEITDIKIYVFYTDFTAY